MNKDLIFKVFKEIRHFKCDKCFKSFKENGNLKTHLRLHTGDRPYICNFSDCEKKFVTLGNLRSHEFNHAENKPFKCNYYDCNKVYSRQCRLDIHKRTHLGVKPFKCLYESCGKSFNEKGNLKTHIRIHTGEKPFICDFSGCGLAFKAHGHLKDHKKRHTNYRPYNCRLCNNSFARSSTLKIHLHTHQGDKPHKCPFKNCNKYFSEKGNMKTHYKNHFINKKSFNEKFEDDNKKIKNNFIEDNESHFKESSCSFENNNIFTSEKLISCEKNLENSNLKENDKPDIKKDLYNLNEKGKFENFIEINVGEGENNTKKSKFTYEEVIKKYRFLKRKIRKLKIKRRLQKQHENKFAERLNNIKKQSLSDFVSDNLQKIDDSVQITNHTDNIELMVNKISKEISYPNSYQNYDDHRYYSNGSIKNVKSLEENSNNYRKDGNNIENLKLTNPENFILDKNVVINNIVDLKYNNQIKNPLQINPSFHKVLINPLNENFSYSQNYLFGNLYKNNNYMNLINNPNILNNNKIPMIFNFPFYTINPYFNSKFDQENNDTIINDKFSSNLIINSNINQKYLNFSPINNSNLNFTLHNNNFPSYFNTNGNLLNINTTHNINSLNIFPTTSSANINEKDKINHQSNLYKDVIDSPTTILRNIIVENQRLLQNYSKDFEGNIENDQVNESKMDLIINSPKDENKLIQNNNVVYNMELYYKNIYQIYSNLLEKLKSIKINNNEYHKDTCINYESLLHDSEKKFTSILNIINDFEKNQIQNK